MNEIKETQHYFSISFVLNNKILYNLKSFLERKSWDNESKTIFTIMIKIPNFSSKSWNLNLLDDIERNVCIIFSNYLNKLLCFYHDSFEMESILKECTNIIFKWMKILSTIFKIVQTEIYFPLNSRSHLNFSPFHR